MSFWSQLRKSKIDTFRLEKGNDLLWNMVRSTRLNA